METKIFNERKIPIKVHRAHKNSICMIQKTGFKYYGIQIRRSTVTDGLFYSNNLLVNTHIEKTFTRYIFK